MVKAHKTYIGLGSMIFNFRMLSDKVNGIKVPNSSSIAIHHIECMESIRNKEFGCMCIMEIHYSMPLHLLSLTLDTLIISRIGNSMWNFNLGKCSLE